jgi:hypothetical protein
MSAPGSPRFRAVAPVPIVWCEESLMMRVRKGVNALLLFALFTAGCGHGSTGNSAVPPGLTGASHTSLVPAVWKAPDYTNQFETAQRKHLRDADIDSYIDSSVTGADRTIVHKLMGQLPPQFRGDIVYIDKNDRVISNNPALLRHFEWRTRLQAPHGAETTAAKIRSIHPTSGQRRTQSYDSCNPGPSNTGPFIRYVSYCGFAGAIGIVTLKCYTSYGSAMGVQGGDNGYLYFELIHMGGTRLEGGLDYYSDHPASLTGPGGMSAYVSNGQFIGMTRQYRYPCDQRLVLAHGLVNGSPRRTYTYVGVVPSNFNPQAYWAGQPIQFSNASILFRDAAPDMANAQTGTDNVGAQTPCTNCSISRVTSIGQHDPNTGQAGSVNDGSAFGYDPVYDDNGVHWEQVAFGEWQTGCGPNAQYCYLQYSRNWDRALNSIDYNDGVPGNPSWVTASEGPTDTNFGPWETWDSIVLPGGAYTPSSHRRADSFSNAQPPNCALDGYGYCVALTGGPGITDQWNYCGSDYTWQLWGPAGEQWYYILDSNGTLTYFDHYVDQCYGDFWDPSEPRTRYGDPNLP